MTLLRLAIAGLLLTAVVRPPVRHWTARAVDGGGRAGSDDGCDEPGVLPRDPDVPLGVAVTVEFVGPLLLALVQTRRVWDLVWAVLAGAGVVLLGLDGGGVGADHRAGAGAARRACSGPATSWPAPGSAGCCRASTVSRSPCWSRRCSPCRSAPRARPGRRPTVGPCSSGAAVALLSSIIPYALELTALRTHPHPGVRRPDEPGAGGRCRRRADRARPGARAPGSWWRWRRSALRASA